MVNCRATMEKDCMWVAIAYHEGFFIRNITALNSEDNIAIDFRRKTKEEMISLASAEYVAVYMRPGARYYIAEVCSHSSISIFQYH